MNLSRTFLHALLVLPFFLVLGTVFADSHSLVGGVVSAKYFWFFASMGCLALTMLFVKSRWPFQMCDLLVFLLVVVQLSVGLISGEPYAKNKFVLLILLFFLYLYVRAYLRWKPKFILHFSNVLVLIAVLEGMIGGMQLYGFSTSNHGLFPMTGTFFNPRSFWRLFGYVVSIGIISVLAFLKQGESIAQFVGQTQSCMDGLYDRLAFFCLHCCFCFGASGFHEPRILAGAVCRKSVGDDAI